MTFWEQNHKRFPHLFSQDVTYEAHVRHSEAARKEAFEVLVGVEVEKLEGVPLELVIKLLPPSTYAGFTLRGDQITADWDQTILTGWMARTGYEPAHPFSLQRYDERFKGLNRIEESVLELYVPIRRSSPRRGVA